jgi:hypothetical protein
VAVSTRSTLRASARSGKGRVLERWLVPLPTLAVDTLRTGACRHGGGYVHRHRRHLTLVFVIGG